MVSESAVVELPLHRLPRHHFEALAAGGGDVETVSHLLATERSWRLVQLRAVLDAVSAHPDAAGPLPPPDAAWELLVAAERQAPSEMDSLLLHPQAGTWAGYVLRRLRGSTDAGTPLWVDVGYLHALAAAASTRAGLDFTTRVPVREGFAPLPTLGGAFMPATGPWEHAEVRGSAGTVTISAGGTSVRVQPDQADVEGWVSLPVLRAEASGLRLSVSLDHLDPYRNLRSPTAPDRLSTEQVARWQSLLTRAWELLAGACPNLAKPIAQGLFSIVPQRAAERFRTMSASAGDAFGSMIISEPEDGPELAVTLVHEFQHIKLGGVLHLAALHHREPSQRLYAPWRDDPRPLGGLLQGVYAFVGIVEYWRALRQQATGRTARLAQFEFARWRLQVERTLETLRALPELTDLGARLVAGLASTATAWREEPVPVDLGAAAEAAVRDHRARWRLHHLRPDPELVATLANAQAAGADQPAVPYPEPVVDPDGRARQLDTRAVLTLWRLTDPDGFARLCDDPSAVGDRVSGATAADLAYVAGDLDRARELFTAELAADPRSPGAWAGLGLVEAAAGTETAETLQAWPELVRAVHHLAGVATAPASDPVASAAWIGRSAGQWRSTAEADRGRNRPAG